MYNDLVSSEDSFASLAVVVTLAALSMVQSLVRKQGMVVGASALAKIGVVLGLVAVALVALEDFGSRLKDDRPGSERGIGKGVGIGLMVAAGLGVVSWVLGSLYS